MKKTNKKTVKNNDYDGVINFYELPSVKVFMPEYNNPNYDPDKNPLKHPMRGIILGASGSGKSNILLNIIHKMSGTFEKIILFTQNKDEPLYNYLESELDPDQFMIFEGLDELNSLDLNDPDMSGQMLFLFDDMICEKHQEKIEEIYIRGRKMSNKDGVSAIYLSQNFYSIPIIIRKNIDTLIIKKINNKRDVTTILGDVALNMNGPTLNNLYKKVCENGHFTDFLLFTLSEHSDKKIRKNFNKILNINEYYVDPRPSKRKNKDEPSDSD
jgi:hypothetical protein